MGDPYFNRVLIHQCDVAAPTTSRSGGEVQVTYGSADTLDCRFAAYSERWADERESRQVQQRHRLMMKPGASIDLRYQVSNIKLKSDGTVVESGPFLVVEILRAADGRSQHHIQVELERSG